MNPFNPFLALSCLLIAVGTAWPFIKCKKPTSNIGLYATIDGLRGYLAIFVFLSHSSIWYFFLRTGKWQEPASNLFVHFGQSSVALFFMITSFLFFNKLLDDRHRKIDWLLLYMSRITRLVPLYLCLMVAFFVIVAVITGGFAQEQTIPVLKKIAQWLAFTYFGSPSFKGSGQSEMLIAGSVWSLPYEWMFYFSLPLLGLTVKVRPRFLVLALSALMMIVSASRRPEFFIFSAFCGGIIASHLVRLPRVCAAASNRAASVVAIVCLVATITLFSTAHSVIPLILLSVTFSIIACGNDLFGLLSLPVSRVLGEQTYSIYLLHLLILFIVFYFVVGFERARSFSVLEHWLVIASTTPILICVGQLSYTIIEEPNHRKARALVGWIRGFRTSKKH